MNRIDVLLADLPAHLAELRAAASFDEQKLVLVTACEQSTLLPCCGQSLGFRNQQLSKLWTPTHLKSEKCSDYWKNVQVICVRKLRKNSAYAKEEEVLATFPEHDRFLARSRMLHNLKPAASPSNKPAPARHPLGARSAACITQVQTPEVSSAKEKFKPVKRPSLASLRDRSPSETVAKPGTGGRARASEPMLRAPAPPRTAERSPVMTRRKSSVALTKPISATTATEVRGAAATARRASAAHVSGMCNSKSQMLTKKPSIASLNNGVQPKKALSGRIVSAPSAIPTPTARRISAANLIDGSPGNPLTAAIAPRRASIATSPLGQIAARRSSHVGPAASIKTTQTSQQQLQAVSAITDARIAELETELSTAKKQKNLLEQGNEVLIAEVRRLKEIVREQEEASEMIAHTWEERYEALKAEKELLTERVSEVADRCAEDLDTTVDWRDQGFDDSACEYEDGRERAIQESLAEGDAYAFAGEETHTPPCSPPATPLRFLTPATGPSQLVSSRVNPSADLLRTPVPPSGLRSMARTPFFTPQEATQSKPSTALQLAEMPKSLGKKVRTPLSVKRAGGKKGLSMWKRLAKRRLFGL